MLRTPMWKIYEESQGNGMTMTARDDFMLNVKFPKYEYVEEVYLTDVAVDQGDANKVKATLRDAQNKAIITAYVQKDTDISRLVDGTKVASLIKDYKESEKATFLTLTKEYSFVEGLITDTSKLEEGKVEIDDVEYKLDSKAKFADDLEDNMFVVVEVDGKKIVDFRNSAVLRVLPSALKDTKEATKSSIKKIDEDALVIIDGKWATREDIEEGDVYTELESDGDNYYMVARERVSGTFESLTYSKDDKERIFVEVDGDEYHTLAEYVENSKFAYEGEEDPKVIENYKPELLTAKKDNDYKDRDVELCMNYLGLVWRVYFGDAEATSTDGHFFVVVSDGVQTRFSEEEKVLSIKLANSDAPEGEWYTFKKGVHSTDFDASVIKEDSVYSGDEVKGIFVWAKVNDDKQITSMAIVSSDLVSGDCVIEKDAIKGYKDDYAFVDFGADSYDKSEKYITADDNEMYKVTADTVVLEAVPIEDEDGDIESFEFRIAEDTEKVLNAAEGGIVAWDTEEKINTAGGTKRLAKFIFITSDAEESELMVGKVEKADEGTKGGFVWIDGTKYEVDMDDLEDEGILENAELDEFEDLDKTFILFAETNNDKIVIKDVLKTDMLLNAPVVIAKSGTLVKLSGDPVELDTELDDDTNKSYKKYDVVHINAEENEKEVVEFIDGSYLGTGIKVSEFAVGDRVVINSGDQKVIYIVSSDDWDEEDTLEADGDDVVIVHPDDEEDNDDDNNQGQTSGNVMPSGDYTVITKITKKNEDATDKASDEVLNTVEEALQETFPRIDLALYTTTLTLASEVDLDTAPVGAGGVFNLSYSLSGNRLTVEITY